MNVFESASKTVSPSKVASLSTTEIETKVRALGQWFHNIDLKGVKTAPDHFLGDYPSVKWKRFADAIPRNLTGLSVLDIGCNGGFYSIEMKRRGAERALGTGFDGDYSIGRAPGRATGEISAV